MSFDTLLIHTCDVMRYTTSGKDAYGNPVKTWAAAYSTEPCRLVSTSATEIKVGVEVVLSDWELFINKSVTEQDRITNIRMRSSGALVDAATFEILSVLPRSSDSLHHRELRLQKVK